MASLDLVVTEINPINDMDMGKKALKPLDPSNKSIENLKIVLYRIYTLIKPIVRGGTLGAGAGALTSLITHSDVGSGAAYGVLIGTTIDYAQYALRAVYLVQDQ